MLHGIETICGKIVVLHIQITYFPVKFIFLKVKTMISFIRSHINPNFESKSLPQKQKKNQRIIHRNPSIERSLKNLNLNQFDYNWKCYKTKSYNCLFNTHYFRSKTWLLIIQQHLRLKGGKLNFEKRNAVAVIQFHANPTN